MTDYSFLSDEQLVVLLRQNDHAAFTEIYLRYWHLLFLYSYKIMQNKDGAEDVVQDIFTTLWNNAQTITISTSIKAYLYITVRNSTLNIIHREKIKGRYLESLTSYIQKDSSFTEEQVRFNELSTIIEKEVENLPSKMQEIFKKSRNEGLSHKIISAELDISENTVKSTINRALKVMRSKLTSLFFILF